MSKPTVNLQGLLTEKPVEPVDPGKGSRLSLQVDRETYRRLRQFSLDHGMNHQTILERALVNFLDANQ